MKKKEARTFAAVADIASGSPSVTHAGTDVSALYIDMLCEKFRNRGIRFGMQNDAEEQRKKDVARRRALGIEKESVSADDKKYKSLFIDGRSYMSSDDFANYYKDLRDYKLPHFYSRAETEYEEAEAKAVAERVQESGKPPKKAVWLAITKHAKSKIKELPSHLNKEELTSFANNWFLLDKEEEVNEGEKKKIPRGVLSIFFAITLSLMLIVCSSVMVSRASADVSSLEDRIDELSYQITDLEGKLEVKNDMLDIKRIAVEEYGMISADYASARYIDIKEDEALETFEDHGREESWLSELLKAIGAKK